MKLKLLLFVICLVTLLAFQAKILTPFLYDIAASDLFLEDSGDEASRTSTTNQMTIAAFKQCNNYIANDILSDYSVTFAENPINAFSLGNFRYVINADLDIQPSDAAAFTKRYVCRIKYSNDDDNAGTSNPDDWSIEGISGLDNL